MEFFKRSGRCGVELGAIVAIEDNRERRAHRLIGGFNANRLRGEKRTKPERGENPQIYAMTSISTSEFPGIPPAAAIVVRTGGSGPKAP